MMRTLFVIFCMEQLLFVSCKCVGWTKASWLLILLPVEILAGFFLIGIVMLFINYLKSLNH
jgi:hypothetical protein